MFKRPGDPEEHIYLYAIPTASLLALYTVGHTLGYEEVPLPVTTELSSSRHLNHRVADI